MTFRHRHILPSAQISGDMRISPADQMTATGRAEPIDLYAAGPLHARLHVGQPRTPDTRAPACAHQRLQRLMGRSLGRALRNA